MSYKHTNFVGFPRNFYCPGVFKSYNARLAFGLLKAMRGW